MKVEIQRNETSQPLVYENVINAYTKGLLFCVLFDTGKGERRVHKFPLCSIFRVIEDYQDKVTDAIEEMLSESEPVARTIAEAREALKDN